MTRKQPNFILISTDQQCATHLGCYGHDILRTPHVDGLAERGRRFTRFHVASGVCMANRASLMTGRHPSAHGVRCNGVPLSLDAVTFVDLLRAAGYRTALAGKCHLQNMTDMAPELPAGLDEGGFTPPPPGLDQAVRPRWEKGYDNEARTAWREDPDHQVTVPYYGFEHVDLCSYHGDLVEGAYYRWLGEKVPDPEALRGQANALPDKRFTLTQAYRTSVPEELYPTNWIADRAMDQLDAAAAEGKPFFLHCSFTDPHHPFTPPGRYWDMYDPDQVTPPATADHDPTTDVFSPVGALRQERQEDRARINSTVAYAATQAEIRQAIALTYGMITMIDDAVGRILNRLRTLGLAKDTVVIFTSDHGDFMGDHGLLLKSALHYSSLVRVPFIWTDPDQPQPGAATDGLWTTMDIGPSILARAGLAPSFGTQGQSFISAVRDPAASGHGRILIEEDGHAPTFGLNRPVRARTAITETYRLTIYDQENWGELYNLREDPEEKHNLFNAPQAEAIRREMFEALARSMLQAADQLPQPIRRA
ncbi:MAG: sulfatase [Qingshengfaniella sp.]